MKRFELDAAITHATTPRALMLFGDSHYLIDFYTRKLLQKEDLSKLELYFDEYDFNSAKAHLSQGSLFHASSLLLVKSEKKIPKKELETLIALCFKQENTFFIYAYYGSDFKKSATAAFDSHKQSSAVRLFTPFPNEAIQIIMQLAKEEGIALAYEQVQTLLELEHYDLALAANEVKKLALYDTAISSASIEALVYGAATIKPEQFYTQFIQKQPYIDAIETLLTHGEDEIRLCSGLSNFIAQLYLFSIYIRIHGAVNCVEILGYKLPPKIEKERVALSMSHSMNTFQEILQTLLHCENALKQSKSNLKKAQFLSYLYRASLLM